MTKRPTSPTAPSEAAVHMLAERPRAWGVMVVCAVAIALLMGSWKGADMRPLELLRDSDNMRQFLADFFPPNFRDWKHYMQEMLVTIQIAIWGTAMAVVASVPVAILAAENITPVWIHQPIRRVLDACRAVNELVFALLFIVAVGLGPFAGVLALFVHTTGTLGKLYSESIEAIDPQPVDGIRATGASRLEEIIYGVLPQVMPTWVSFTLYRFEANVRGASVLGIVGAGGIGQVLWEVMRGFQYAETCALLIIIVASVSIIDFISARLRALLI